MIPPAAHPRPSLPTATTPLTPPPPLHPPHRCHPNSLPISLHSRRKDTQHVANQISYPTWEQHLLLFHPHACPPLSPAVPSHSYESRALPCPHQCRVLPHEGLYDLPGREENPGSVHEQHLTYSPGIVLEERLHLETAGPWGAPGRGEGAGTGKMARWGKKAKGLLSPPLVPDKGKDSC